MFDVWKYKPHCLPEACVCGFPHLCGITRRRHEALRPKATPRVSGRRVSTYGPLRHIPFLITISVRNRVDDETREVLSTLATFVGERDQRIQALFTLLVKRNVFAAAEFSREV